MFTTSFKLRLVVGAGVAALILVGGVALVATHRAAVISGVEAELRFVQGLLVLLLLLAVVLAWFAYASLQDDLIRRTEVEAALRASEAKFSGILEIADDAFISIDEQHRILHYNRGAEKIFGWSADDIRGRSLSVLIPERYRGSHSGHIKTFGEAPGTARQMADRGEIYGLRRDGTEFPAEASISKLVTSSDEHIYTVSLRDVTERKQRELAQRHLTAAVSELGQTLDVSDTERTIVHLAVPWLADGAVLSVLTGTGQFRRIPSSTRSPALDASLYAVTELGLDLDSPSQVVDVVRRRRTERIDRVDDEWIEAHTSDANEFRLVRALGMKSVLLLPLLARDKVLGVLKIFRTETRPFSDAEQSAAEALALRGAFALDNSYSYATARQATEARDHALGLVSHDLRNPISAIGMCGRALLAATPKDDKERRELVETIIASTELTQRMIRDLLDVASIEVGRLSIERRIESVGPIMERAMGMFTREAMDREILLRLDPLPDLPNVVGDAERLVQALANLLSNAMRHTDRGGEVVVSARVHREGVEVSVRDTGSGIPPESLSLIFERYWTVRGNAPKGGTGLGLAIARGIVEAHGGRLWADTKVGVGSTFRFTIPKSA